MTKAYSVLKLDEQDNLHSEDGPAFVSEEGYSIYAIHGKILTKEEHDALIMEKKYAAATQEILRGPPSRG